MKSNSFFIPAFFALLLPLIAPNAARGESVVPRFDPRAASVKNGGGPPVAVSPAPAPGSPAPAPSHALNEYQRERLERYLAGAAAVDDTLSLIAIQVQFADSLMGGQERSVRKELHDSLYFANELKHVAQYFGGASRNRLVVRWEVTGGIYTLPEKMGYYGDDRLQDNRAVEMMQSVIEFSDDEIDFSLYDTVMLIHAGAGQETDLADDSRVQLWSSFYSRGDIGSAFPDSTVYGLATNDTRGGEPFLVDNFLLVPESASQDRYTVGSLGVWVFEVGSRLGLVPLQDSTPAGFPDSRGASSFDLMAYGLYNGHVTRDSLTADLILWPGFVPGYPSVFNRLVAGWIDPLVVEKDGGYRVRDLNAPLVGDTACIKIPITEGEYYLVVNRVHDANFDGLFTFTDIDSDFFPENADSLGGAEFDFFLTVLTDPFEIKPVPGRSGFLWPFIDTGTGMYIWHVDETVIRQTIATGYLPNDFVSRKGVDLEEADGIQDLDGTAGPFSFGSHFDSFRQGNNTTFGPETNPSSVSNSEAQTGITISGISGVGDLMTCTITFAPPYEETRTRWAEGASYQPPSLVDLDGAEGMEIVVFAETTEVYAFRTDGSEFVDRDGIPETVEPYVTAPGARWVGPPAVGDIDGGGDVEIVACDERGAVYAWKRDGTEVFDGDGDPTTTGVLYRGAPLASPPVLVDVDDDEMLEIVFVERKPDTLIAMFVDREGRVNQPSGADFVVVWGEPVRAQACSPLAFGALGDRRADTEGVAFVWADTLNALMGFSYLPLRYRGDPSGLATVSYVWTPTGSPAATFPVSSSIAVGDLGGDGFDEAVFTLPDASLVVYSGLEGVAPQAYGSAPAPPEGPFRIIELRSSNPSAPAIGDVDGNGTLEIALWDDDYFYVYEHNGKLRTNWPQPLRPTALGDFPTLVFDEGLVSPLIGDVDGDDVPEILFPRGDGAVYGFDADGRRLPLFPRAVPDGMEATPSIGKIGGAGLGLVCLGRTPSIVSVDAVSDSVVTAPSLVLSIQTLPGSNGDERGDWFAYQRGLTRQGRWVRTSPPSTASVPVEPGTFKIYPNPVSGREVHARIVVNKEARVSVEIYNLEGERAASKTLTVNGGNVIQTPFDEVIDVGGLKSGVYVLRLVVKTEKGVESFVSNFAILR